MTRIAVLLLAAALALPALAQRKAIPLAQASQVGKTLFQPGATPKGGNGQPVDGIEALSREMLKTHFHAHLALFYHGEQIAVPAAIGIVAPFEADKGFVGRGKAIYWVHTHDASGIIHVESPDDRPYTLGNFFDIWGQPLTKSNVAGLAGKVRVYLNGKPYSGDPRKIRLTEHAQIALVVGEPAVTPPSYIFPEGL